MIFLEKKDSKIEKSIKTVVTIGNFDGIHLGHQGLIKKIMDIATEENLSSVVLSFYPHPRKILNKDFDFKTIFTQDEKVNLLVSFGVDYFRQKPIDLDFLSYTPKDFVEKVLIDELNTKHIVVGRDFHFGSNRVASAEELKELCKSFGIVTTIIDLDLYGSEKISSSLIRKCILEADFYNVRKLLGRPYYITGIVVDGKKLGRTIGVPTANIYPYSEKLLPKNGVYFSQTHHKGKIYNSITNIGINPTIEQKETVAETYILDFDEYIYGDFIKVDILDFLRGEVKFESVHELKKQLHFDIERAIEYFQNLS